MWFFEKVSFCTISSAHISHNDRHISCPLLRDFGVIFLNVPFFELSKLFISFLISFGVTSEKLHSVGLLKYFKYTRMVDIFI